MQSSESSDSLKKTDAQPVAEVSAQSETNKNLDKPTDNKTQSLARPRRHVFIRLCAWILRLLLGVTFIFSGFSKAVDPWGGLYKVGEYLNAWGFELSHEILVVLACMLAGFEFILGVMILIGAYRRSAAWLSMFFMAFMTALTFYIWLDDPVSDCGCFGDALVLSNTMTLAKNVVLMILTVFFVNINSSAICLIRPRLQWLALILTGAYVLVLEVYGYNFQPLVDFRPYPVGTNLAKLVNEAEENDDENIRFIYEKDGIQKSFAADSIPEDDSWKFVDREVLDDGKPMLAFFDEGEDVTSDVVKSKGDQLILLISDPERYGLARAEMTNRMYDYLKKHGTDMFVAVAVNPDSLQNWKEAEEAHYPVYSAEDTDLKMLARGDAAIVALRDGIIVWKTNMFALEPEIAGGLISLDKMIVEEGERPLFKLTMLWLICMALVFGLSRFVGLVGMFIRRRKEKERIISPTPVEEKKTESSSETEKDKNENTNS